MLLRALFWIGLVALLMPREPDLGFGRPGTQGLSSDALAMAKNAVSQSAGVCSGRESLCTAGLGLLDSLQQNAVQDLAQVKQQIEAQQRARARS